MADEEREEENGGKGLERFLEIKDIADLSPVNLTCEPAINKDHNDIEYYPVVRVKSGKQIRGVTPLNLSGIKNELFRLKSVLEKRGYIVSSVYIDML